MDDADLWELLTKHGVQKDSATAIVQSHRGMGDADLWERLKQNGASPEAASSIVRARGGGGGGGPTTKGEVPRGMGADITRSALHGASFGLLEKPIAAVESVTAGLPKWLGGEGRGGTYGERYHAQLEAGRGAQKQFETEHPYIDLAAQAAGGMVPSLLTLGMGGAGTAANVADKAQKIQKLAKLAKAGQRIVRAGEIGAGLGAGAGYLNEEGWGLPAMQGALRGGLAGGIGGVVGGGLVEGGGVLARGVGKAAKRGADASGLTALAGKITDMLKTAPVPMRPQLERALASVNAKLEQVSGAFGTKGKATTKLTQAMHADEMTPGAVGPVAGVPFMAIDEALPGGSLEALAQDVLHGGEGGGRLATKLRTRAEEAGPRLSQQIKQLTGVGPGESGQQLRRVQTTKKQTMDAVYDEARRLTEGDPVTSKTFEQITTKTQAGRMARSMAESQRSNRPERPPLPRVKQTVQEPPPGWYKGAPDRAWDPAKDPSVSKQIEVEVPDAELVHLTKMNLAKLAKLGERDVAGGVVGAEAQAQGRLFHQVRGEMGDEFAHADEVATLQNRIADAAQQGQRIFSTKEMPTGRTLKGTIARDLESALGPRPPEAAEEFRIGAANAAQNLLRTKGGGGANVGKLFTKDAERIRQTAAAFKSPSDATKFQAAAAEWRKIAQQARSLVGGSQTAGRTAIRERRQDEAMSALTQLLHLHPVQAARTVLKGASQREQQAVQRVIEDVLASEDAGKLSQVEAQALIRQAVLSRLTNVTGRIGGAVVSGRALQNR